MRSQPANDVWSKKGRPYVAEASQANDAVGAGQFVPREPLGVECLPFAPDNRHGFLPGGAGLDLEMRDLRREAGVGIALLVCRLDADGPEQHFHQHQDGHAVAAANTSFFQMKSVFNGARARSASEGFVLDRREDSAVRRFLAWIWAWRTSPVSGLRVGTVWPRRTSTSRERKSPRWREPGASDLLSEGHRPPVYLSNGRAMPASLLSSSPSLQMISDQGDCRQAGNRQGRWLRRRDRQKLVLGVARLRT